MLWSLLKIFVFLGLATALALARVQHTEPEISHDILFLKL
jgi:hypothetical protein